ncbi:hypothetical protein AB0L05_16600 [Nonomuraea pusilla]|uniref:hypothetical protein n=1 Tax=Nonomuraea pusilla TaxID=46177 RepID=UPI00332CBA3C
MRNPLPKVASLAVLAGALFLPVAPASAAPATTASAASKLDDPFAVFDVKVKATKVAKVGGKIRYSISATNTGPYSADAWFVGGELPKGVDMRKVYFRSSVRGTECAVSGRSIFCLLPKVLEKGDSVSMTFDTKVTKSARGVQKAVLGVVSYDVQQGMEGLDKEELDRLGIPGHAYAKQVKTRLVR